MQKPVFFVNSVTRDNFNKAITEIAESAYKSRNNETFKIALLLSNAFGETPQVSQLAVLAADMGWDFYMPSETYFKFEHYSPFRAEEWMKTFADVIELAAETVYNWENLDRKNEQDHTDQVRETRLFIDNIIDLIKAIGLHKRETLALWDVREQYFFFRVNVQSFYKFHGVELVPENLFDK